MKLSLKKKSVVFVKLLSGYFSVGIEKVTGRGRTQ